MKKSKKLVFKFPKEMFVETNGITFIKNGSKQSDGLFFQSKNKGKKVKNPDGLILQNSTLHGDGMTVAPDHFRSMYSMTVKQLESLLKIVKKKEAYFTKLDKKKGRKGFGFYVHFSPDLSIFFKK